MRTTVTLDPDVVALIRGAMKERRVSFEEAVNLAVRSGLRKSQGSPAFVQTAYPLGAERLFHWDKALATADAMEDEAIVRELGLRK